jgi:hypothetical protein
MSARAFGSLAVMDRICRFGTLHQSSAAPPAAARPMPTGQRTSIQFPSLAMRGFPLIGGNRNPNLIEQHSSGIVRHRSAADRRATSSTNGQI